MSIFPKSTKATKATKASGSAGELRSKKRRRLGCQGGAVAWGSGSFNLIYEGQLLLTSIKWHDLKEPLLSGEIWKRSSKERQHWGAEGRGRNRLPEKDFTVSTTIMKSDNFENNLVLHLAMKMLGWLWICQCELEAGTSWEEVPVLQVSQEMCIYQFWIKTFDHIWRELKRGSLHQLVKTQNGGVVMKHRGRLSHL